MSKNKMRVRESDMTYQMTIRLMHSWLSESRKKGLKAYWIDIDTHFLLKAVKGPHRIDGKESRVVRTK